MPKTENRKPKTGAQRPGPTERARKIIQEYTAYSVAKSSGVPISVVQRFQIDGTCPSAEVIHKMLLAVGKSVVLGAETEN